MRGSGVGDFARGKLAHGAADVDLGECLCGTVCVVGMCVLVGGVVSG